jgi:hypothetical protein
MRNFFIVCAVLMGLAFIADRVNDSSSEDTSKSQKKEIHCIQCNKDLTDTYNRISPNFNDIYYCTLCYQKTKREINRELRAEGYDM